MSCWLRSSTTVSSLRSLAWSWMFLSCLDPRALIFLAACLWLVIWLLSCSYCANWYTHFGVWFAFFTVHWIVIYNNDFFSFFLILSFWVYIEFLTLQLIIIIIIIITITITITLNINSLVDIFLVKSKVEFSIIQKLIESYVLVIIISYIMLFLTKILIYWQKRENINLSSHPNWFKKNN